MTAAAAAEDDDDEAAVREDIALFSPIEELVEFRGLFEVG